MLRSLIFLVLGYGTVAKEVSDVGKNLFFFSNAWRGSLELPIESRREEVSRVIVSAIFTFHPLGAGAFVFLTQVILIVSRLHSKYVQHY